MGLTRSEQWTLCFVVILMLVGFVLQAQRARQGGAVAWIETDSEWQSLAASSSVPARSPAAEAGAARPQGVGLPSPASDGQASGRSIPGPGLIDLNTASQEELELLPGIGPAKARAILDHRAEIQGFKSIDDLLAVPGIGPRTQERLRPFISISAVPGTPASIGEQAAASPDSTGLQAIDNIDVRLDASRPVDINSASFEELQRIHGIGPVLADRIIAERALRPFATPEDLIRVKGIGPRTLERMRAQIRVH